MAFASISTFSPRRVPAARESPVGIGTPHAGPFAAVGARPSRLPCTAARRPDSRTGGGPHERARDHRSVAGAQVSVKVRGDAAGGQRLARVSPRRVATAPSTRLPTSSAYVELDGIAPKSTPPAPAPIAGLPAANIMNPSLP